MKEIQSSELIIMVENRGGGGGARGSQVCRRLKRYASLSGKVLSWGAGVHGKCSVIPGLIFFAAFISALL